MKVNTNTIIDITLNLIVAQKVKNTLPEVLIDYLISLLPRDWEKIGSQYVFRLSKNNLGGREIQDIVYIGENKVPEIHRVFGCNSIDAEIIVDSDGAGYRMSMA